MRRTNNKSAAQIAHEDMVRATPQQQIDREVLKALSTAKLWYKLNNKKFVMPKVR
jgi:hypothetical protein